MTEAASQGQGFLPSNICRLFEKYFVLLAGVVSIAVIGLNYNARSMQGIIPNYLDFKRIIKAGFDPSAGYYANPTFPMWGYGWLLLLTENKMVLLLLQNLLALFAVWFFFRFMQRQSILPARYIQLSKLLLLISLPWFAFHSVLWPYSIAISLFLICFTQLLEGLLSSTPSTVRLVLSGAAFGTLLNFRSDYYMMPFVFAAVVLLFYGKIWSVIRKTLVWLASIYLMLVPWAIYAKRATGHYLLTSTNSGHVFFIGMGNLPGNKWGISPFDEDPVMRSVIDNQFGRKYSTLRYDSNVFLKQEFKKMVSGDPGEYLKKCSYALRDMLIQGVYSGEFLETPDGSYNSLARLKDMHGQFKSSPLQFVLKIDADKIRYFANTYSIAFGRAVVLLSFLLIPLTAYEAIRNRNVFVMLLLTSIIYQSAINVFAYHMPAYTTNMYFMHIVNLASGVYVIQRFMKDRKETKCAG